MTLRLVLRSRLTQILEWFGEGFDGCIVLDECHKVLCLRTMHILKTFTTFVYSSTLQKPQISLNDPLLCVRQRTRRQSQQRLCARCNSDYLRHDSFMCRQQAQ